MLQSTASFDAGFMELLCADIEIVADGTDGSSYLVAQLQAIFDNPANVKVPRTIRLADGTLDDTRLTSRLRSGPRNMKGLGGVTQLRLSGRCVGERLDGVTIGGFGRVGFAQHHACAHELGPTRFVARIGF